MTMTIDETVERINGISARITAPNQVFYDADRVALLSAIEHLRGIQREMREVAMGRAIDMCQGRHKNDYTDAFDANVVVKQADIFYAYAETGETE